AMSRWRAATRLAGSGLTLPRHPGARGVPEVNGIIDLIRQEYEGRPAQLERFEQAITAAKNPYQTAFQRLIMTRSQDASNRIIRRAVLQAQRVGPKAL